MDWIKKNPHQFTLALLAILLIASSVFIILRTLNFSETFAALETAPTRNDQIAELEMSVITDAQKAVQEPSGWAERPGSLLVSEKYVLINNVLTPVNPETRFFGDIPSGWLLKYDLGLLSASVLDEDPDGDGFTNEEEYYGASRKAETENPDGDADSTNPKDKTSHPPYHTLLFLKQYIKVPFRLRYQSDNGDRKNPATLEFQINTLDLRQASQFLKLGDMVENTKFRLEKWEEKSQPNPNTPGVDDDVSELTLLNTETQETVVLIKERITDSPDSFALFTYTWPNPPIDFRVRKLQQFALQPIVNERYRLLLVSDTEAVIELPSKEKYTVPKGP